VADPDLSVRATPRRRSRDGIVPRPAFDERGLRRPPRPGAGAGIRLSAT